MRRIGLLMIIISFLLSTAGFAKEPAPKVPQKDSEKLNGVDSRTMNVFMKQIEIYGRIAKPQTVFIIPGTDPRVDGIRIERYFYRDIFRPVEISTLRKEKQKAQRQQEHILW